MNPLRPTCVAVVIGVITVQRLPLRVINQRPLAWSHGRTHCSEERTKCLQPNLCELQPKTGFQDLMFIDALPCRMQRHNRADCDSNLQDACLTWSQVWSQ